MEAARHQKVADSLAHLAAEFLRIESNRQSLVTVTRATISKDFKNATIFFTVMPTNMEKHALEFIKRRGVDFRTYVKEHAHLRRIPFFDFEIDVGEKHRQRLDEVSRQIEKQTPQ